MKNRLILLSLIGLCLFGCNKEEGSVFDTRGRGPGYALKNGNPWEVQTVALNYNSKKNEVDIYLNIVDDDGIARESLGFLNTKLVEGENLIGKMDDSKLLTDFGIYYVTLVADGDVVGDSFYSPQSRPEYFLDIESYNEENGEVTATFDCIVTGTPNFDLSLPDTLRFEDGWLRVKVQK